jgi:hypothetical protein
VDETSRRYTEVVTWYDPLAAAARGRDLSGVDYLRAIWTGDLPDPPIAKVFGMRSSTWRKGAS